MFRKSKPKARQQGRAKIKKPAAVERPATLNPVQTDTHTRTRILDAALEQFGARGFTATSVRDLATAAGVNVAAINYYFGSKEALRVEALRHGFSPTVQIAARMRDIMAGAQQKGTIDAAEQALREYVHVFLRELVGPDSKHWAMFMRERLAPGPAFEIVVREYFAPLGSALGGIISMLLPGHPEESIGPCIQSVIAQCVHVRTSAPTVKIFSGKDPTTPKFLERTANHIAEFSVMALRGMRDADPPRNADTRRHRRG